MVLPYAIQLFADGDWERVAEIDLTSIDQTYVPGVIRERTIRERIDELKSLQILSRGLLENDEDTVIEQGGIVAESRESYGCEPLKKFLTHLQMGGMILGVRKFYPSLCPACKEQVMFPGLLMETAIASQSEKSIREVFLECGDSLSPMISLSYASALDDLDASSEALEFISERGYFEESPSAIQLRAKYDSFFYALRTGRFMLASELIKWADNYSKADIQSLYSSYYDGFESVPPGYYDELIKWRCVNRYLAEVLCKEFDTAQRCLEDLLANPTDLDKEPGFVIEELDGNKWGISRDFGLWLSELLDWAREQSESTTYSSEVSSRLAQAAHQFGLPEVGQIQPESRTGAVNTLLLLGGKSRLTALTNWRTQAAINEERGDVSHLVASLRSYIPAFSALSEGAKSSLMSAESRYTSSALHFDPASTIHSYCKGLEIELREVHFADLRRDIKNHESFLEALSEAKTSKNAKQTSNVVRYLEGGFAELGVMVRCLRFASGKTAKSVMLFGLVRDWLNRRLPFMLDKGFIDALDVVVRELRNPSAHDATLVTEDIAKARELVGSLLNELSKPRSMSA